MRIKLVFTISDAARRLLDAPHRTQTGLATRQTVKDWVRNRLEHLDSVAQWYEAPQLTDTEIEEGAQAYVYLRSMGKTETECWQWIYKQRVYKERVLDRVLENQLRCMHDRRSVQP